MLRIVFKLSKFFFCYDRKTQPEIKRRVIQDASRVRKALAKCVLNPSDYVKFTDETKKFLEDFDL